jgi:hypothetical protein
MEEIHFQEPCSSLLQGSSFALHSAGQPAKYWSSLPDEREWPRRFRRELRCHLSVASRLANHSYSIIQSVCCSNAYTAIASCLAGSPGCISLGIDQSTIDRRREIRNFDGPLRSCPFPQVITAHSCVFSNQTPHIHTCREFLRYIELSSCQR